MRIDLYTMVHNEAHILPFFFRHYDQYIYKYFVWDDASTDGSTELLKAHRRVTLLDISYSGLNDEWARQNFWPLYKRYSRESWRGKGADWVFCVDADEFIYDPQLFSKLESYRKEGFELVTPVGYTMMSQNGMPPNMGQLYHYIKYGFRDRSLSKPIIFVPEIDIKFFPGRHMHEVLRHENDAEKVRKRWKSKIMCLHFRHFGDDYYIERLKKNCERMSTIKSQYFERRPVWPFDPNRKWRMPDSVRAHPRQWLEENAHKVVRVIK